MEEQERKRKQEEEREKRRLQEEERKVRGYSHSNTLSPELSSLDLWPWLLMA